MKQIVFPDPLIWQAGIEYGLEALAEVWKERHDFVIILADQGPLLEAVALASHQLSLADAIHFVGNTRQYIMNANIVLLPRVIHRAEHEIYQVLRQGKTIVTSEPGISEKHARLICFPRRNSHALVHILQKTCAEMAIRAMK